MTLKSVTLHVANTVSVLVSIAATVTLGYFYPWYLLTSVLLGLLGASCWFLWKFSRIIMILEDDMGQAIQALEEVEESMKQMIEMKLYFDTPEVQQHVSGILESVRMARFSVNKMVKSLTDRSKQKFVMIIEEDSVDDDKNDEDDDRRGGEEKENMERQKKRRLPPSEGTVASVGRRN